MARRTSKWWRSMVIAYLGYPIRHRFYIYTTTSETRLYGTIFNEKSTCFTP